MTADVRLNENVIQLTGDTLRGTADGKHTIELDIKNAKLAIGGKGTDGDVILIGEGDKKRVHIAGGDGPDSPDVRILMNGWRSTVKLGGKGAGGVLTFRDDSDEVALQLVCNKNAERGKNARILLDGDSGTARFNAVLLGTKGAGGELIFRNDNDEPALQFVCNKAAKRLEKARILLDGDSGTAKLNDVLLGTIGSLTTKLQDLENRLAKLESA